MGALSAFLAKNVKPAKATESFVISDRFVERDENGKEVLDKKGNPVFAKFTIKALKPSKFMRIASGSVSVSTDGTALNEAGATASSMQLIVESLVEPDLRNPDLQESYGVLTPLDLIDAMLTTSEVQKILEHINKMQAGEGTFQDKVEEVKN